MLAWRCSIEWRAKMWFLSLVTLFTCLFAPASIAYLKISCSSTVTHCSVCLPLSREYHDRLLHDRLDGRLRCGICSLQLHRSTNRNALLHTQHTHTCQHYRVLNVHRSETLSHTRLHSHTCTHVPHKDRTVTCAAASTDGLKSKRII